MKNDKKYKSYNVDELDRKILRALLKDARTSLSDLAKDFAVSVGTIHQRVAKMEEAQVIKGSKIIIEPKTLGLGVTVLLGIHLKNARDVKIVLENLKMFDQVVEAYYTTGSYALIIKVVAKDITDFHLFLVEKLQAIKEIQSTESFICLDTPLSRDIVP